MCPYHALANKTATVADADMAQHMYDLAHGSPGGELLVTPFGSFALILGKLTWLSHPSTSVSFGEHEPWRGP